ncbi:MAG: TonB-dependent receptor [Dialister sp.]|nr:TonB-dependent receptor [Dialister sp.]
MRKYTRLQAAVTGVLMGGLLMAPAVMAADVFDLSEVVVTANRTEQLVQHVPSAMAVITDQDIKERNITNVRDAIQQTPGMYVSKQAEGSSGGTGGILLRGFDTKSILVLVDGQPMNSTYNSDVNLNDIPVDNIKKIEVLRGAASSIYGGHAVGGVISITTNEATQKGAKVKGEVSYGSHDTWKKSIYVNAKANEKISFGVGYEQRKSDGFRGFYRTASGKTGTASVTADLPKLSDGSYVYGGRGEKEWEHESYSAYVKYNFNEDQSLKYSFARTESDYAYRNPFSYVKDSKGNPMYSGSVQTQDGNVINLSTARFYGYVGEAKKDRHIFAYEDKKNNLTATYGYTNDKYDGFTSPNLPKGYKDVDWTGIGDYSSHPEKTHNLDIIKVWKNVADRHTILAGFNFKQDEMAQDRYDLKSWRNINSKTNKYAQDKGKVKNYALYFQDEFKATKQLTIYIGGRYDHFKKGAGTFWADARAGNYNTTSDGKSYNEFSPKLAVDYKLNDTTNVYASYGHSFNPPPLYNIYRFGGSGMGKAIPNPDLDPETSDTYELGIKKKIGDRTHMALTLYYIKTDDVITYGSFKGLHPYESKQGTWKQYVNYGREKRRGMEFEIDHKFTDHLTGYFNWAWQTGKMSGSAIANSTNLKDYDNLADYEIPKHLLHAGLNYNKDRWNVILDCLYSSARMSPDEVSGEYGAEDAFFLVNAAVNYDISSNLTIRFGIDNLFDRHFYCNEAADGRTYTLGLRYSI